MCKTKYWQSFSNSYPINRALSLSALWKNPEQKSSIRPKKKYIYFPSTKELAPICMFALNGDTFSPALFICQVWAALKVGNFGSTENDEVLDSARNANSVVCYLCAVVVTNVLTFITPQGHNSNETEGENILPRRLKLCWMKTNKKWDKNKFVLIKPTVFWLF